MLGTKAYDVLASIDKSHCSQINIIGKYMYIELIYNN